MNRIYAVILVCFASISSFSQVAFTVISPASISGGYEFTSNGDAPNWGLANLLNPADAIQDTVVIFEDGTPGINAQGIPLSNEGCSPSTIDLTGKIALIYRYDGVSTNVCYAGTKVLNAQNAGAIGVIMVNREDGVYGYDGTTDGPLTNIPFAFIGKSDGALIRAKIEAGEDVVAFIGNKLGLYPNDVGMVKLNALAPTIASTNALTSQNASEFGFDLGTRIYNYGSSTQNNVTLTATITGPNGTWTETAGPYTLSSGDSIDVITGGTNSIPAYSMATYPVGNYVMEYNLSISAMDDSEFDNNLTYNFILNDSIVSYAKSDPITNLPIANTYTRSLNPNFTACMVYRNPHASRLATNGIYFAAEPGYNTGAILEGESFNVTLFQWNDNFIDLNDAGFGFTDLTLLAIGTYEFGANLESTMIFAPFTDAVQFSDNQRYLACVDVLNDDFWIGYNNRIDYTANINHYLQPLTPVSSNSNFALIGFDEDLAPAIGLRTFDAELLGMVENSSIKVSIYPNPASDQLAIHVNSNITHAEIVDFTGRVIQQITLHSGINSINIKPLEQGEYFLKVIDDKGDKRVTKFVKI